MNFKYLIFLCLMFIVSMGAVSAADDVNSTFNANIDVNDVPVDSIIIDNPICENAKEYTITNDNYGNYFDNETGDALEEAPFNNGDILKIDNVSDKYFVINKNLTIMPAGDNITLKNVGFNFVPGSEGSVVNGLTIDNNVGKWSNNNAIQLVPILIQHAKDITVINSYIHSSAASVPAINGAIYMVNASYCNIRNNTISQSSGKTPIQIVSSSYNNMTDNKIYSKASNVIFIGMGFNTYSVAGISEFNIFKNNIINGTTGISSAWCYAIKLQGNSMKNKLVGQNTFIGNVISNAFIGVNAVADVGEVVIINNTFVNIKTGIDVSTNVVGGGIVVKGNSINVSNIGISLKKGYGIIENNTIDAVGDGIQLAANAKNITVDNNVIISGKNYAVSVAGTTGTNTSITNNYIISKDYYGNGAVTSKSNDTIIENNTPAGASINADISASINKNATIKIDVLPFDAMVM